jgi:hypothetical protein
MRVERDEEEQATKVGISTTDLAVASIPHALLWVASLNGLALEGGSYLAVVALMVLGQGMGYHGGFNVGFAVAKQIGLRAFSDYSEKLRKEMLKIVKAHMDEPDGDKSGNA